MYSSDRVSIWRFSNAPPELRTGYSGTDQPAWLAVVPKLVRSSGIDETMSVLPGVELISHYETPQGDLVLIGGNANAPSAADRLPKANRQVAGQEQRAVPALPGASSGSDLSKLT